MTNRITNIIMYALSKESSLSLLLAYLLKDSRFLRLKASRSKTDGRQAKWDDQRFRSRKQLDNGGDTVAVFNAGYS